MAHLQTTMRKIEAEEAARADAVKDVMAEAVAGYDASNFAPTPGEPVWRDGDPDVSDWIIYQPRRGSVRRGRNRVAALVVYRHPHARLLDLAIFYEANDMLDDQRVPEAVGDERGWLVKRSPSLLLAHAGHIDPGFLPESAQRADAVAELRQDIADLRTLILGGFQKPEHSVLDLLSMLDERVDKLESAKPKAKRKYVRKAKPAAAPAEKVD